MADEHFEYKSIRFDLVDFMGLAPFIKVAEAGMYPGPKIEKVSVSASSFTVFFAGGESDKVKANVTFSNDFKVTRAELEDKQTFPGK